MDQMQREVVKRNAKAVVFLGDLAPHKTNIHIGDPVSDIEVKEIYYQLKAALYNLSKKYFKEFRNEKGERIPVYMGLGNHDTLYNKETPNVQNDKTQYDYLTFLKEIYLDGPKSLAMGNYDKERSLYENIASYVVKDIFNVQKTDSEYISLIYFNTLFYLREGNPEKFVREAKYGLKWFEELLKNSPPSEKFILTQHAYGGITIDSHLNFEWVEEYQIEFQRIIEQYGDKIIISLAGHLHLFKMNLPTYYSNKDHESILHLNLGSFSPVISNNPAYYFLKLSTGEAKASFVDLLIQEIDLSELITKEKSLLNVILTDLAPVENRVVDTTSAHTQWANHFKAVIDLFINPEEDFEAAQERLRKYILLMVAHNDMNSANARKAVSQGGNISLDSPYSDKDILRQFYCSSITFTETDFKKCI